ncbi:MAG: DoxX family protein [Muribaculaceae bacterium]|nr:DoxX family protein [Muribaculaceae bacterium]
MKQLIRFIFCNKPLSETGLSLTLLLFRIFAGGMMLPYGIGKIQNFQEYSINFFDDPIGIGMVPSLVLTIFAQVGCATALIGGIFSRPAAMILAFNMLIASRYHWHDEFATLSLPLLFLGIYCLLSIMGSGKYSIDSLLFDRRK